MSAARRGRLALSLFPLVACAGTPAPGAHAVAPEAERRVAAPIALAVARRDAAGGPGPSITLGSDESAALYLRFEPVWQRGRVQSAFLVLAPQGDAAARSDVVVEAWRARRPWHSGAMRWSEQPGVLPPFARGVAHGAPAQPLRVDVTALVSYWAAHPESDHGLLLRAPHGDALGVQLATGIDGGALPRLEVYLRK